MKVKDLMRSIIGMRLVMFSMIFLAGATTASALTGNWRGELKMGPAALPLVFNFSETEDGKTSCTLDSPQQNVKGLPMNVDYLSSDSIAVTSTMIGATFRGHIGAAEIKGIFQQRGYSFQMTLVQDEPLSVRRPQTPHPPYPYQTVDTTFISTDGTVLSGTVVIPHKSSGRKMPMVVMVSGSGPQNRDEEIFEHRPFAVIADFLARNGIASFRYDDRGTAGSKGDFMVATTYTFRDDADAALRFARGIKNVGKAGILGHSEGGTIAIMLAEENLPDFIVSLAGMAISGEETILDQNRRLMEKYGVDPQKTEEYMKVIERFFSEISVQTKEGRMERIDIEALAVESGVVLPPMFLQSLKMNEEKRTDYFSTFLTIDPRNELWKIKCPVLALNGTLDTQVDASKNLSAIREGIKKAEIHELPGLNHLFQHAVTGEIAEYDNIRETISPEVLTLISSFISRLIDK